MDMFSKDVSKLGWEEIKRRQSHRLPLAHQWVQLTKMEMGSKVLDIGPGPGVFLTEYVSRVGSEGEVYAIEKSEEAVSLLRQEFKKAKNVTIFHGDAEQHSDAMDVVDIVMITDILHHTDAPDRVLQNVYENIKPKTRVLISEFDPDAEGMIGPPLRYRLLLKGVEQMVKQAGFEVIDKGHQKYEHYYIVASK
jgi:ubiquinone/menaquinone biosynthesis C-methylase UbiE